MTVVFSASSVNTYQLCHLQWWFTYIAAIPTEPTEPQAVGTAVHAHAESLLKIDDVTHFDPGDDPDPSIRTLVNVFRRDILPTYRNVLLVEQPFQIDVDGIPFSGVIDSLDEQDTSWGPENILRDLKTTKSRPPEGKYRYNMVGYYVGVTEGLDIGVTIMQLDYIVRTQKPYYWPEVVPVPDEDEIRGWAAQLEIVANHVARGDYEPTGLGTYVCNFCDYRSMCGPYQRLKERT